MEPGAWSQVCAVALAAARLRPAAGLGSESSEAATLLQLPPQLGAVGQLWQHLPGEGILTKDTPDQCQPDRLRLAPRKAGFTERKKETKQRCPPGVEGHQEVSLRSAQDLEPGPWFIYAPALPLDSVSASVNWE